MPVSALKAQTANAPKAVVAATAVAEVVVVSAVPALTAAPPQAKASSSPCSLKTKVRPRAPNPKPKATSPATTTVNPANPVNAAHVTVMDATVAPVANALCAMSSQKMALLKCNPA